MQDIDEHDQSARQHHRAATQLMTDQHPVRTAPARHIATVEAPELFSTDQNNKHGEAQEINLK